MIIRTYSAGKVVVKVAGGLSCAAGALAFYALRHNGARALAVGMGVSGLIMFKSAIEDATIVIYGTPPKTKGKNKATTSNV